MTTNYVKVKKKSVFHVILFIILPTLPVYTIFHIIRRNYANKTYLNHLNNCFYLFLKSQELSIVVVQILYILYFHFRPSHIHQTSEIKNKCYDGKCTKFYNCFCERQTTHMHRQD